MDFASNLKKVSIFVLVVIQIITWDLKIIPKSWKNICWMINERKKESVQVTVQKIFRRGYDRLLTINNRYWLSFLLMLSTEQI